MYPLILSFGSNVDNMAAVVDPHVGRTLCRSTTRASSSPSSGGSGHPLSLIRRSALVTEPQSLIEDRRSHAVVVTKICTASTDSRVTRSTAGGTSATHVVDVPVPRILKDTVEVMMLAPQEQGQRRRVWRSAWRGKIAEVVQITAQKDITECIAEGRGRHISSAH